MVSTSRIVDVHFFSGEARYRTVVAMDVAAPGGQAQYSLNVVDCAERRYAVAGALTEQLPGLPLKSLLLDVNDRVHLVGVLDAEPRGTNLNVFFGRTETGQRERSGFAFQLREGVVVADLGPRTAGLAISHITSTDPDGAVLGRAVAEPMVELLTLTTHLSALDWRPEDPHLALDTICTQ